MSIDAMKQALEALETIRPQNMSPKIHPAKVALRAAIEAAERQEPVAKVKKCHMDDRDWFDIDPLVPHDNFTSGQLLYTTPQAERQQNTSEHSEPVAEVVGGLRWIESVPWSKRPTSGYLYTTPQPAIPEWQPIETAPRDGTDILAMYMHIDTQIVHNAFWNDYEDAEEEEIGWWSYEHSEVSRIKLDDWMTPTHWMPLPAAPKKEGE